MKKVFFALLGSILLLTGCMGSPKVSDIETALDKSFPTIGSDWKIYSSKPEVEKDDDLGKILTYEFEGEDYELAYATVIQNKFEVEYLLNVYDDYDIKGTTCTTKTYYIFATTEYIESRTAHESFIKNFESFCSEINGEIEK